MPVYEYTGRNISGEVIKGIFESDDELATASMLKSKGIFPITIKEKEQSKDLKNIIKSITYRVKLKDLSAYCRQFSSIINAGIPIVKTLEILEKQSINPILAKSTRKVNEDIKKGLTLGSAFRNNSDVFPEMFINMVEAGEISGSLNTTLERLAVHYEQENALINKVKSAITYPIILSITAVAVVIFLTTTVLPTFLSFFESYGAVLPIPTRLLLNIIDFIGRYWLLILALVLTLIFMFFRIRSTEKGRLALEYLKLNLPLLGGTLKKITLSRFARTLSTMLSSGIPLLDAIDSVNYVIESEMLKNECEKIMENVQKGTGISEVIRLGAYFPPFFVEMVAVGEETGKLDDMLNKVADYYDEEVKFTFDRLTNIIEPVIIVVMACVVGFIIISIILPMFEMLHFVG